MFTIPAGANFSRGWRSPWSRASTFDRTRSTICRRRGERKVHRRRESGLRKVQGDRRPHRGRCADYRRPTAGAVGRHSVEARGRGSKHRAASQGDEDHSPALAGFGERQNICMHCARLSTAPRTLQSRDREGAVGRLQALEKRTLLASRSRLSNLGGRTCVIRLPPCPGELSRTSPVFRSSRRMPT